MISDDPDARRARKMGCMKRSASELCWFTACCLLVGFFGLYLLGVDLKAVDGWPLDQVLPVVVLGAVAAAAAVGLIVTAYRMERN